MQLMQSQLSPHFLFNCLGSISYLARRSAGEALVDAVSKLGDLLRFTIENASRPRITVLEELRFARDYVDLQSLRFGDRFDCNIDCDAGAESAECVPFSLQPLLENVFRHVVEQVADEPGALPDPVTIDVAVELSGGDVVMRVCNSRVPDPRLHDSSNGNGTGIGNLKTRLTHTYGQRFRLENTTSPTSYCVALQFPSTVPGDVA